MKAIRLTLAIFALSLLVAGCDASEADLFGTGLSGKGENQTAPALDDDLLYPPDAFAKEFTRELAIPMSQSPDFDVVAGAPRFNFCVAPNGSLNLTNAAWMAFFAAQEYAHLASIVPPVFDLGFGHGGDFLWPICARDLHDLRDIEELPPEHPRALPEALTTGYLRDAWGMCARDWFERTHPEYLDTSKLRPTGLSAKFEQWLIQDTDPASYLQFYSSGSFETKWEAGQKTVAFEKGSTQAMWARHRELPMVIVAFRGTEPSVIKDVVADAKFWKTSLEDQPAKWGAGWGKVHRGFYDAFMAVADSPESTSPSTMLVDKLKELEGTGVGIWITGHSLGAALATLFASRILAEIERGKDYRLMGVYTFGSPRVGIEDFKDKLEGAAAQHGASLIRFRNHHDLVTRIPKGWYEHVGQMQWFDANGTLSPYLGEDQIPGRGFFAPLTKLIDDGRDHMMSSYYERTLSARSALPQHDLCQAMP